MANTKISNLPGAASVTDASVLPVVDSGTTKKVTGLQIKNYARTGLSTVASTGSYADLSNKPTIFDGNYNSLTNKPTIPSITGLATETYVNTAVGAISIPTVPTNLSQLTNDVGFLTTWGQADWNEQITESPAYIQNKPTIPTDINQLTDSSNLLGQGGGTSYDQSLNTTDSPAFSGLSVGGELNLYTVKQVRGSYVNCQPNVDTVIYTATGQWQHTIKLLVQVEGIEGGQGPWETQSCEIIVSRSFVNNKVAGSVYGLVYTSNAALATFTARWNNTTSRVEVVCRPESTISNVVAHAFATEISTAD